MNLSKPWISPASFPICHWVFFEIQSGKKLEDLFPFFIIKVFLWDELVWLVPESSAMIRRSSFVSLCEFSNDEKAKLVPKWISTLIVLLRLLSSVDALTFRIPYASPSFPSSLRMTILSPTRISWYHLSMELWWKVLPHTLCSQGPCLLQNPRCLISSGHHLKAFLHPLHTYNFLPLWILWCWMSCAFPKALVHFCIDRIFVACEFADAALECWRCLPHFHWFSPK